MNNFWQDLRYAVRILLKNPGFTLGAVLILALGIGINSAIFNGVSAFIIRPLAGVSDPGRLIVPFEIDSDGDFSYSLSFPDYVEYRNRNRSLEGLIAHRLVQAALGIREQNDIIYGQMVSGNYFDVLGVTPQLGRRFLPEEDRTPNTHPVVVLSRDLWQSRFAGETGIVGKQIALNGYQFTVIGVAPKEFQGTKWGLSLDFWAPMMMQEKILPGSNLLNDRGAHWLEVMGRLKPGVTTDQASGDLTAAAAQLNSEFPGDRAPNIKVRVLPEIEGRFDEAAGVIKLGSLLAMAAVGLVLMIVCANVANLLLARGLARRKEIAIRLALGAGRFRLVRQLLTESILLAFIGGIIGLIISFWISDLIFLFAPRLPYRMVMNMTPDAGVMLFTVAISIATGIIFGLAPALQASNPDVAPVLKGEEYSSSLSRRRFSLRDALVVSQVAISLVILVCGGLLFKSHQNSRRIDPGFNSDEVLAITLTPGLLGYDRERGGQFYRHLVERTSALPGIKKATLAGLLPLGDSSSSSGPVVVEGRPAPPPGEGLNVLYNTVSPGHFETLQIPLVLGRDFNQNDRHDGIRVTIINQTLAARLWPGQNALGRRFSVGGAENLYQVIGVSADGKYRSLGEAPRPYMYFPLSQRYQTEMTLLARTTGEPLNYAASIKETVKGIDPQIPLANIRSMKQHLSFALWGARMGASLATGFGSMSLLLAAMGIYSVIAYSVSQRTREIGIRMALGAQRRDVIRTVAGQGIKLAVIGMAIGLPLAFGLSRMLSGVLTGVSGSDPIVYSTIAALLITVSALASWLPARRAAKVDPIIALRQ